MRRVLGYGLEVQAFMVTITVAIMIRIYLITYYMACNFYVFTDWILVKKTRWDVFDLGKKRSNSE